MNKDDSLSCPYCGYELAAMPHDKTACPNCENILYISKSILGEEDVLLTEEGYYKIVRSKKRDEESDYFTERMNELKASFGKAKASIMHYGELGRDLEVAVRKLLEEYLPNKYRVDTGFVRSLEKPGWRSNQIDILLSRNDICYPLAIHHEYKVYPLESIISFMEVTSNLTSAKMREDYEKVTELQRLNKQLYFVPKVPAGVNQWLAYNAPRPRFYYFAYSTEWSEKETVKRNLLKLSNDYRIQLHATFVLDHGWWFMMPNATPGAKTPYSDLHIIDSMPDSFIAFLQHVLLNLQTADFIPPNGSIPFSYYYDPNYRLPEKPVS